MSAYLSCLIHIASFYTMNCGKPPCSVVSGLPLRCLYHGQTQAQSVEVSRKVIETVLPDLNLAVQASATLKCSISDVALVVQQIASPLLVGSRAGAGL